MKWNVSVFNSLAYGYSVDADDALEAKEKARILHCNPKTQDIPVSDWDYEAEIDESA